MPAIYYWTAPFLYLLPLAEWSIRLPTVVIAIVSIVLIYSLGRRVFADWRFALCSAVVLGCAPAFFMLSRYALDYVDEVIANGIYEVEVSWIPEGAPTT